jgi:predicted ArsR family transcriptional regulator
MSATATKTTPPEAHRSSVIAVLALAEGPLTLEQVAKAAGLEATEALRMLARLLTEVWVESVSLEATCETCGQSRGRRTRYQLRAERCR